MDAITASSALVTGLSDEKVKRVLSLPLSLPPRPIAHSDGGGGSAAAVVATSTISAAPSYLASSLPPSLRPPPTAHSDGGGGIPAYLSLSLPFPSPVSAQGALSAIRRITILPSIESTDEELRRRFEPRSLGGGRAPPRDRAVAIGAASASSTIPLPAISPSSLGGRALAADESSAAADEGAHVSALIAALPRLARLHGTGVHPSILTPSPKNNEWLRF